MGLTLSVASTHFSSLSLLISKTGVALEMEEVIDVVVRNEGKPVQGALFPALTKRETKVRQLVNTEPLESWDKCWEEGVTPWDLGGETPVIVHLAEGDALPNGRALVPGCGAGYDVMALAKPSRHVTGLDISEKALRRARQLAEESPKKDYVEFLNEDFFAWKPDQPFDLIFDYTFFVAMEPHIRHIVAKRFAKLLSPNGELLILMFPVDDHQGGPPYAVSIEAYEKVLHPLGFTVISIEDNELAVESRKVEQADTP